MKCDCFTCHFGFALFRLDGTFVDLTKMISCFDFSLLSQSDVIYIVLTQNTLALDALYVE